MSRDRKASGATKASSAKASVVKANPVKAGLVVKASPVKTNSRVARKSAAPAAKPPGELWGTKVALVISDFHSDITEKLASGATEVFQKSGAQIDRFSVPGAFEIAGVITRLARSRRYDGLIAIGCVIRGETEHYDLVVDQVREGVGKVSAGGDVPVTFGVLAVENRKQAVDRAGGKLGNLGTEAAEALLKLIPIYRRTTHPALVQAGQGHG